MSKIREETPLDLIGVKCPDCGSELKRYGDRSQINFKCVNRECSRFISSVRLRLLVVKKQRKED